MRLQGSNQYKSKYPWHKIHPLVYIGLLTLLAQFIIYREMEVNWERNIISPLGSPVFAQKEVIKPLTVDEMVDKYSTRFGKRFEDQTRTKVLLHFLLKQEAAYGTNKGCGDSGKACGPLQFHEPTYIEYRKIMIERGLVTEIGSRFDMEDAIETCAWAINDGREKAWGPLLRGEIKV